MPRVNADGRRLRDRDMLCTVSGIGVRMQAKKSHVLAVGLFLASTSGIAFAADVGIQSLATRIDALRDATYVGGMNSEMQAMAQEARELAQRELQRPLRACGSFNSLRGTLVNEEKAPDDIDGPKLDVANMLAELWSSPRPVVRDTAAYVLGEVGPDAQRALAGKVFRFDHWTPWQAHAGSRIRCTRLSLGEVNRVIPQATVSAWITPSATPAGRMAAGNLTLLAEHALRDPELIWPDGLFADWLNDHDVEPDDEVAPATLRSLGGIISDRRRPPGLRADVARLVETWGPKAAPAAPGLRLALAEGNEDLAYSAAGALLEIGGEAGVDGAQWMLAQDVPLEFHLNDLCSLGPSSASRLSSFYTKALTSPNWKNAETAAKLLECVEANDSVDQLLVALDRPVWRIQVAAAKALRTLASSQAEVRARLDGLAKEHWSGVVRDAASGAADGRAVPADGLDVIDLGCFHRCYVAHNPSSCAGKEIRDGLYAIDGGAPFRVRWNRVKRHAPPEGFPLNLAQDQRENYGSNTFLRVPGGWLYGTDRWHYDGEFAFVSDSGKRVALPSFGREPAVLAEVPDFGRIALGRGLFFADDAGVLSVLNQDAEGNWSAEPRIALPTVPHAWAIAPDGRLLVADPDNAVAVWPSGRIANLQCARGNKSP
jgi:hypothetical protein